jgi:hypothetical protein
MKHRSPYSLVDVKLVDVEALAQRLKGPRCVVGGDVAKKELAVCVYGPEREFARPWKVKSPGQVPLLLENLAVLAARGEVVLAMESSGTYGDPLRQ